MAQVEGERIELKLELVLESGAAFKVSDGRTTCWLSRSLCSFDGDMFYLPAWLAKERGLL